MCEKTLCHLGKQEADVAKAVVEDLLSLLLRTQFFSVDPLINHLWLKLNLHGNMPAQGTTHTAAKGLTATTM